VGLANLGSESETCVGSRVHLVGVFISFEKNFYRLPFTPPLWFAVSVLQILAAEAVTAGAPTMGLTGEPGAEAIAAVEATRPATPLALHVAASTLAKKSKNYDARSPPRQATTMASPPSLHGFAIYFSQRNLNLWGSPSTTRTRIQYSGSDATPSPSKTLVEHQHVPQPGSYPLVVAPLFKSRRIHKVLMDGGSGINVLYGSTLDEMGIPRSVLRPSTVPFHGVVLGIEVLPLGQIDLSVTFREVRNFRTETLTLKWWGSWGCIMRSSGGRHMRSLWLCPIIRT
jgi:hypothetical protein